MFSFLFALTAAATPWSPQDLQAAEPMFQDAFQRAMKHQGSAPVQLNHLRHVANAKLLAKVDTEVVVAVRQTGLARHPWVVQRVVDDSLLESAATDFLLSNNIVDTANHDVVLEFIEDGYAQYNEYLFGTVHVDLYGTGMEDFGFDALQEDIQEILDTAVIYGSAWEDLGAAWDTMEILWGLGDAADSVTDALEGNEDDLTGMFDDLDGDGIANWLDPDNDGDGYDDDEDDFPNDSTRHCFPPIWYLTDQVQFATLPSVDPLDLTAVVLVSVDMQTAWTWSAPMGTWNYRF
jgi:hypothetical protein